MRARFEKPPWGKAPGLDGIPAEMWNALGGNIQALVTLFNRCWQDEVEDCIDTTKPKPLSATPDLLVSRYLGIGPSLDMTSQNCPLHHREAPAGWPLVGAAGATRCP